MLFFISKNFLLPVLQLQQSNILRIGIIRRHCFYKVWITYIPIENKTFFLLAKNKTRITCEKKDIIRRVCKSMYTNHCYNNTI